MAVAVNPQVEVVSVNLAEGHLHEQQVLAETLIADAPQEEVAAVQADAAQSAIRKAPHSFLRRSTGRGVGGAQQISKPSAGKVGLLSFLRGTGTDFHGNTLDDILAWDFAKMEKCHDYIQWVFPTDERSKHNLRAPLLTPQIRSAVRGDTAALENIRKSLRRFCDFLGLEIEYAKRASDAPLVSMDLAGPSVEVRRAPHFEDRVIICWQGGHMGNGGNHNWLRISRVLHCLRLVGLDQEAAALLQCLEGLLSYGIRCNVALTHWRKRAATEISVLGSEGVQPVSTSRMRSPRSPRSPRLDDAPKEFKDTLRSSLSPRKGDEVRKDFKDTLRSNEAPKDFKDTLRFSPRCSASPRDFKDSLRSSQSPRRIDEKPKDFKDTLRSSSKSPLR